MKRLTLDQTWVECLKMWRWIVRQVKVAKAKRGSWGTDGLKQQWLAAHGYEPSKISSTCFFCDWDDKYIASGCCSRCPAVMIEKDWTCSEARHYYLCKPIAFLAELNRLNRIRLKKTASKRITK